MHTARNPIIVALDLPDPAAALDLARRVAPHVGAFKVGKELFVSSGPPILEALRATGAHVFLDLKFHDIPHTVARAVAAATRLDVQMLTVHAGGGREMLEAAREAADTTAAALDRPAPLILGVTVLTSMNTPQLLATGVPGPLEAQVSRLATLAVDAGLRGLVCSPRELPLLRGTLPPDIQYVTPGIRPADAPPDDQKRTLTPQEALELGATWLVIGRPIVAAADPVAAAARMAAACPTARIAQFP